MAVSAIVVVVSLTGLVAIMISGLNERRRELAILRAVGAQPREILLLLLYEGMFVTLLSIVTGLTALTLASLLAAPLMQAHFGITMTLHWLSAEELQLLAIIALVGLFASLFPAYMAYRLSLADGLTPRL